MKRDGGCEFERRRLRNRTQRRAALQWSSAAHAFVTNVPLSAAMALRVACIRGFVAYLQKPSG
jgi:hypothetical protein